MTKFGKSALWRARGRNQADSKEVIHTLMEDNEFRSSSRGTGEWVITGEASRRRRCPSAPLSEKRWG